MDTKIWGPNFWQTMNFIAFNYPLQITHNEQDQQIKQYTRLFFKSLSYLLPCEDCIKHFQKLLAVYPIDDHLESRLDLTTWLVMLHNKVNERLGKKQWSYNTISEYYEKCRVVQCNKNNESSHCCNNPHSDIIMSSKLDSDNNNKNNKTTATPHFLYIFIIISLFFIIVLLLQQLNKKKKVNKIN